MITILGIESSCDDTSAAILRDGIVLSNVIASQKVHEAYGGVVPELASRAHQQNIIPVVSEAMKRAGVQASDINAVAFTRGPGLLGSLLVGVSFAKGFAIANRIPMIEVNHLQAHILANFIREPGVESRHPAFPFLTLLVSGGNSQLIVVRDYLDMEMIGQTIDDAAGEAFDKVARTLGLPYPGGPSVAAAAKTGDPRAYRLPVPHVEGKYNVSFSGLKTAVLNEVNQARMKGQEVSVPDLAASFQERIDGILAEKLLLAAADTGAKQVCLAGGVAANGRLRQLVNDGAQKLGAQVYLPQLKFCGDNGAMIAAQGYYEYRAGHTAGLDLNGLPTLPIDYI